MSNSKNAKSVAAKAAKPEATKAEAATTGKKIGKPAAKDAKAAKAAPAKAPKAPKGERAERRALQDVDYKVVTADAEFRGLRGAAWKVVAKATNTSKVIGKAIQAGEKEGEIDATYVAFFVSNGNIKLAA